MSLKLLAVEGCQLGFSDNPDPPDPPIYQGTISILPPPVSTVSFHSSCQGKKVYIAIAFMVTAFVGTVGGIPISNGNSAVPGLITGTTDKVKDMTVSPIRKGDVADIVITDTVSPYSSVTVSVKVSDPGQQKAAAV